MCKDCKAASHVKNIVIYPSKMLLKKGIYLAAIERLKDNVIGCVWLRILLQSTNKLLLNKWNNAKLKNYPFWLRDDCCKKIHGPMQSHLSILKVSNLMCQGSKRWNTNLLNNIFCLGLVDTITRVPLLPLVSKDARTWGPSPNGVYAIKSAYHLCMNHIVDSRPIP